MARHRLDRAGARRLPWRLVFAVLAAAWLALLLVTPHPVNPVVDPAIGLEAHSAAPAEVRSLVRRACYDCHSNETRWPWYSRAFPSSWLVSHDVEEGRGQMNLSRWSDYSIYDRADWLDEACKQVRAGDMPPPQYRWLHPEARLSDADVDALCLWTSNEADRLVQGGME